CCRPVSTAPPNWPTCSVSLAPPSTAPSNATRRPPDHKTAAAVPQKHSAGSTVQRPQHPTRAVNRSRTDRRIAQARRLFDDDVVAGHRYGAASKGPNFRQHLERRSESGDLREDLLGSADHLSVVDVVSGLVPRADQSPVRTPSAPGDDRTAVRPPRRGGRAPTHFLRWHYATHTNRRPESWCES